MGASRSIGQRTEHASPVLCANTLEHVEFGIAAGNMRGACVKAMLKDVGSCPRRIRRLILKRKLFIQCRYVEDRFAFATYRDETE